MLGIIARIDSDTENVLVARELSFHAKTARTVPHARVEPVDRAADLCDELHETVIAVHVSKLMQQHYPPSLGVPLFCSSRQKNDRTNHSPRCGHDSRLTHQHSDIAGNPESRFQFRDESLPLAAGDG